MLWTEPPSLHPKFIYKKIPDSYLSVIVERKKKLFLFNCRLDSLRLQFVNYKLKLLEYFFVSDIYCKN
jgi:hypothetical protein